MRTGKWYYYIIPIIYTFVVCLFFFYRRRLKLLYKNDMTHLYSLMSSIPITALHMLQ